MRQEPDTIECPACNAVKPRHEEEVKATKEAEKPQVKVGAGGFTFAPAAGAAGAVSSSGFTFGAPSSSASSAAKPGGFTFGGIPAATGPDGHLSFDGQGLKLNTEAAEALLKNLGLAEVAWWKLEQTPLLLAARWNRPDDIKRLLEVGDNVNERDGYGLTALHMAASYGNPGTQFNRHF